MIQSQNLPSLVIVVQIEIKRTNVNASGTVGALNFTASDGHSVANISAVGDGDNEGAHLVFRTTSAAGEKVPLVVQL